jgi:hypothetical protein
MRIPRGGIYREAGALSLIHLARLMISLIV